MTTQLDRTNQTFKALGHPARLRMLAMLRGGDLCVCQLTAVLDLAPSTVSAHLADLRRAGFVVEEKEGRWVHVRLSESSDACRVFELLWHQLSGDDQIAADTRAVERLREMALDELCSLSKGELRLTLQESPGAVGDSGWSGSSP